jgi:hypothetical protein
MVQFQANLGLIPLDFLRVLQDSKGLGNYEKRKAEGWGNGRMG